MVRAFDGRPIPRDCVERLLAYTQRGPSSGFTQGFEFLVFDGPEQTSTFWSSISPATRDYLAAVTPAPLIIVPFAHEQAYVDRYRQPDKLATARESGADFPAPYWFIDPAFAAMLVLLGAIDEGLGAFYFSVDANRRAVESFVKRFAVPDGNWPIGAIAVGYPREEGGPDRKAIKAGRRRAEHVLHMGTW
jgi:nitroreductase